MTPAANIPCVVFGAGRHSFIAFSVGRKFVHAVAMDQPIQVVKLPIGSPIEEARLRGKPYPVRRAARVYLRSAISKTDRAKKVLRALARGETSIRP